MNLPQKAILLITIWIIQYMFPPIWYSYTRFKLHQKFVQTELSFKQTNVITLHFTDPGNIHWESNHSEIFYHNQLYDVISKACKNGEIIFKCKSDANETRFLAIYNQLKTEQKILAFKLLKSFQIVSFSSFDNEVFGIRQVEQSAMHLSMEQLDKINSGSFKVPHQPPEIKPISEQFNSYLLYNMKNV